MAGGRTHSAWWDLPWHIGGLAHFAASGARLCFAERGTGEDPRAPGGEGKGKEGNTRATSGIVFYCDSGGSSGLGRPKIPIQTTKMSRSPKRDLHRHWTIRPLQNAFGSEGKNLGAGEFFGTGTWQRNEPFKGLLRAG